MGCPAECVIGDNLTFGITTHDPDTGVVTNADAVPTYLLYEDGNETAILSGDVDDGTGAANQEFDDANTTGLYLKTIACTAGNGFEDGKTYTVYITAIVDGDEGGFTCAFKAVAGRATAAKMLAYLQLMVRKDDAIEQDNAVELLELNADEGSGGGAFMNETESLEAILDHGNVAWLTGSSGGATKSYTTTDWTRTVGDPDGGVGSDTVSVDGVYFATGETSAGTFLEVDAVFTLDAPTENALKVEIWGFYNGGGTHSIQVQALDTVSVIYEPIGTMSMETAVNKHSFDLSPNHTDSGTGTVTLKFIHQGVGNPSHVFNIDKAQVNSSLASAAGSVTVGTMTQFALSQFATDDTGETTTVAGSVAKLSQGAGGSAGAGSISWCIKTEDTSNNPLDGVAVWITTDSAGTNVVAGTLPSDALGVTTFLLDAGAYYVWRQLSGYNFPNPQAFTVS